MRRNIFVFFLLILVEGDSGLEVCTIEGERSGPYYAFDTVQLLGEQFSGEFWFIIGSDVLGRLGSWYRIGELINQVRFCVALRPGCE